MAREKKTETWVGLGSQLVPEVGKNLVGLLLPMPTPPYRSREQAAVLSH